MTVTRAPEAHNGTSSHLAQSVIRGLQAVGGFLLAAATFVSALTGLIALITSR
ncbi:hypothetical protein [Paractinoplanes rishiriensis]|uniref:Uncharacterized protein n=1 Tax=Paractinoplanes rishiriensis TaxID=1050105 RepID=A0A919K4I6_9ACTN|nr:hypothetical protein [Actinoplanes rishiriensis]GIE98697.1 hypothetical protein Ari01nite_61620 [Actinoplanes rishiriensis]